MKRSSSIPLSVVVLAALCGGCATAPDSPTFVLDQQKIQRVERAAVLVGAQVRWVNPPYRIAERGTTGM